MKKILLLFVMLLGWNLGAFANNIIQTEKMAVSEVSISEDSPVWKLIRWKDGTATLINDGKHCVDIYDEYGNNGLVEYTGSFGC